MLALVACALVLQAPAGPPRLRTVLSNGATVLVEKMAGAESLSVGLFVSSRGTRETRRTHGWRHLLEHIVARGTSGSLDSRLETAGGFLRARTLRDAMHFDLTLPPGRLSLALEAVRELLSQPIFTSEAIATEARILEQEAALLDVPTRLSSAAWEAAYGEWGLSPQGTMDIIRNAPPEELRKLHTEMFQGPNVVLVVAGDVDLADATREVKAVLGGLLRGVRNATAPPAPAAAARVETTGAGEARAAVVPGAADQRAAAALAAALAVASGIDNSFVIYTPSVGPGMILLGRAGETSGVGLALEELGDGSELLSLGKGLAREWVQRQLRTPTGVTWLRGLMMVQSPELTPETLSGNIGRLTRSQLVEGLSLLRKQRAFVVVGG